MSFDLAWLDEAPSIKWKKRTYTADYPSKDTGIMLTAIYAVGMSTVADALAAQMGTKPTGGSVTEAQREIVERLTAEGVEVADLALGSTYVQMVEDRVPGPVIDRFAMYASYYWVIGKQSASALMESAFGGGAAGEAG